MLVLCVTVYMTLHQPVIQVVQETQALLVTRGYEFDFRGVVSIKGKGSLITYFARETPKTIKTLHS